MELDTDYTGSAPQIRTWSPGSSKNHFGSPVLSSLNVIYPGFIASNRNSLRKSTCEMVVRPSGLKIGEIVNIKHKLKRTIAKIR
jgi:hypothetical protein